MQSIFNKSLNNVTVNIRVAIGFFFVSIAILTLSASSMIQYRYYFNSETDKVIDKFGIVSKEMKLKIEKMDEFALGVVDRTSNFLEFTDGIFSDQDKLMSISKILIKAISQNNDVQSIYIADVNDNLLKVSNLQRKQKAENDNFWLVVTQSNSLGEPANYHYFDSSLNLTNSEVGDKLINLSYREWYYSSGEQSVTKSSIYAFIDSKTMGYTYSKKVARKQLVVGLDYTLDTIKSYLKGSGNPSTLGLNYSAYIFDSNGNTIASNNPETQIPPHELIKLSQNTKAIDIVNTIDISNTTFLSYVDKFDTTGNAHFAVLFKKSNIHSIISDRLLPFVFISLASILIITPFVWALSKSVAKPINNLAYQAQMIGQRRYSKVELISSRIEEIHLLSRSMSDMAAEIDNHEKGQKEFIDSLINLVADAIDEKSPYTGAHCLRVPELAMMLLECVHYSNRGKFKDFTVDTEEEWREFRVASLLHDCGKITTPEYVVDKATKLETKYNRIHEIRTRFEVLWRDAQISNLKLQNDGLITKEEAEKRMKDRLLELRGQFNLVAQANIGSEYMSDEMIEQIKEIGQQRWVKNFDDTIGLSELEVERYQLDERHDITTEYLLSDKASHAIPRDRAYNLPPELGINMDIPDLLYNLGEVYNLTIRKGTLTAEERFKINEHMISGIKMLNNIPFPDELSRVPRYATTHHEALNGKGYPRRLNADALSIPERILAISDVFEALTSTDRPYKKANSVSEALKIMGLMVQDKHLDGDLVKMFIDEKIYLKYALKHLNASQIDM
ncbi:HD-GYP domain-containing protein [Vibrio vulnificus]|uniref:HD-GYP domain-containing protein n=1 Tax=Vibrio vulnificus TaxID=672 RepID=UPI00102990AA|nr:HD domain-containing phosphohydrolase [Vibrio vulnificus]RZR38155.1 HAMP domain-containing protein [Vibrio vulnificus]